MSLHLFADHCVSRYVIEQLREAGHDVSRLSDHLPADSPDPAVIAKAQQLHAVLLSLNGDFADIVNYPPSLYEGIIALQVKNHPETTGQVTTRLKEYLALHPDIQHYNGKLLLVEVHRIRIRQ